LIVIALLLCSTAFAQAEQTMRTSDDDAKNVKELRKEKSKKMEATATLKNNELPEKNEMQNVTIKGGRQSDLDERRLSTASRMIFGREELERNGDSNLADVLKRLPGVTIGGRAGRGGDIRMRGMGSGYTQILINGERAPRGFSMDSLSPDQVERIEIMRGPVAEYSTQAIAGTINIVLREDYKQKDVELKLTGSLEQGRGAKNISLTYPDQYGALSYSLSGSVFQKTQRDQSATHIEELDSLDKIILLQDLHDETYRQTNGIQLAPRLNFRFEDGDTMMLQPFIMNSRSDSRSVSTLTQIPRATAQYANAISISSSESNFARGFGNWQRKFTDNSKLNFKFGGGLARTDSASLRKQFSVNGELLNTISDVNNTRDSTLNFGGKYTLPLDGNHTLAVGLDGETGSRSQTRISLDNGRPQFAESGDNLNASTGRLAGFLQDEFDINPQWSAYAGLRWERIHTKSVTAINTVDHSSEVWSPLLHAVWRLPGGSKDQVRMGLTSSYRAPALNDLIALPSISPLNSPTKPDRTGNPYLKPEKAKGIDFGFEHYLTRAGIMSANVFVRSIDDLIRRQTEQVATSNGLRWVSSPINIGHAITHGVELEAKFQMQEFFPSGPVIDFRSNYSHFWSRVDDIQGPNNRLDQQPNQTANFGLDYRPFGVALTLGGSVTWTPSYFTQTSDAQTNFTGIKRQIDLYGLWKLSPGLQLRLSANNLQAFDAISASNVLAGGINHEQISIAKTYTTWSLKLEMKL
jgi:outer membrane receptor for ferrienterochelin and colicins